LPLDPDAGKSNACSLERREKKKNPGVDDPASHSGEKWKEGGVSHHFYYSNITRNEE